MPETTHYLKHTTIHVNVTGGNAWLPVGESVLVTCIDVYFYTRHTQCAIFEMTDLSPIEHAFDKGQTKGRRTSTQQQQKTAAKNSIIKEIHSLMRSTGNLRASIIRIKTKQTAHLLTPAEGCHNKRKSSFNLCFLYIF